MDHRQEHGHQILLFLPQCRLLSYLLHVEKREEEKVAMVAKWVIFPSLCWLSLISQKKKTGPAPSIDLLMQEQAGSFVSQPYIPLAIPPANSTLPPNPQVSQMRFPMLMSSHAAPYWMPMALLQQANPQQTYMPPQLMAHQQPHNQSGSVETPATYQQQVPPSFYGGSNKWLDAGITQPWTQFGGDEFSLNPFDGSYENDSEDDNDPPAGGAYEEDYDEQDPNATLQGPVTFNPPQRYLPNLPQDAPNSLLDLPLLSLHNQVTASGLLQITHQQPPQTSMPQQRISQFLLAATAAAPLLSHSEVNCRLTPQTHKVQKIYLIQLMLSYHLLRLQDLQSILSVHTASTTGPLRCHHHMSFNNMLTCHVYHLQLQMMFHSPCMSLTQANTESLTNLVQSHDDCAQVSILIRTLHHEWLLIWRPYLMMLVTFTSPI